MGVRAIRGAITIDNNTKQEIYEATEELLNEIIKSNEIQQNDIISIIFTVTKDITAAFPAYAARKMGFTNIPLMCSHEMDVPGSLKKCIRILLHFNTEKSLDEVTHVYLKGAKILRPDLAK